MAIASYGRASHYDFDNPQKWVTVPDVPLLDEHEMTGEDGRAIAYVGRKELEEIAFNNNKRVTDTGDPTTLILGHTSDAPHAPEKPAKGFVVNYKVKPFKRDPKTGQVIYAVHGDYKIRPKNASIIEEYPRRSVELWWNKKEIDPVAILGGTTPERDLSVIIRKSRLYHVALLGGTVPERDLSTTVRFSRRANDTIEHYAIDAAPIRKSSHISNKTKPSGNGTMKRGTGMASPNRYEANQFDQADGLNDTDDGMGLGIGGDDGTGNPEDDAERDPVLAKVFQSQQWKTMQQQMEQMTGQLGELIEVLQQGQGMEGEEEGQGGDEGMPPEEGAEDGGEEVMGGDDEEGVEGEEGNPEEEERRDHGEQPVQFESTGFPGPMNTNIPTTGRNKGTQYSRKGNTMPKNNNEVVQLKRQVEGLTAKLARKEAESIVSALESEGILFGDSPEEHTAGKREEVEFLSYLDDESRDTQVDVIRKRYKRRPTNPAANGMPGVARYARSQVSNGAGIEGQTESPEEFEPQSPQEACDLADLESGPRKLSRADAVKVIRKKRSQGAYPASNASTMNFGV